MLKFHLKKSIQWQFQDDNQNSIFMSIGIHICCLYYITNYQYLTYPHIQMNTTQRQLLYPFKIYSDQNHKSEELMCQLDDDKITIRQRNGHQVLAYSFTQHVFWRVRNGQPGTKPTLISFTIGTSTFYAPEKTLLELRKALSELSIFANYTENYENIDELEECRYGNLWLSKNRLTGQKCATKIISKEFATSIIEQAFPFESSSNEKYGLVRRRVLKEVAMIRKLKHPYIITLLELFEDEQNFYQVFEFMEGLTLDDWINQNKIPTSFTIVIMRNLLEALAFMHANDIIHRDIKPQNILFGQQGNPYSLKIIDFELATPADIPKFETLSCGTPGYMAPEVIKIKKNVAKYDKVCDIFSAGAVFYKLLKNEELFAAKNLEQVYKLNLICNVGNLKDLNYGTSKPDVTKDLVLRMLAWDPKLRATAQQCLQHPFFQLEEHTNKKIFQLDSDTFTKSIQSGSTMNSQMEIEKGKNSGNRSEESCVFPDGDSWNYLEDEPSIEGPPSKFRRN